MLALDAAKSIEDADEARRTVPVLVLTILVFFVHKPLHLEPATVALAVRRSRCWSLASRCTTRSPGSSG